MAELKVVLTMALVQLLYSVYNLLVRASLVTGINPVVFAVYRDLLALLMLWPLAFFLERRLWTRISPTVLIMLLFSGITGIYAFQVLALLGLAYTSAPLIAGIQNMTPVFTFIIGVVFRYTHPNSFSFLKPSCCPKELRADSDVFLRSLECLEQPCSVRRLLKIAFKAIWLRHSLV
jgi:drug/metabolite transporter (DMT)-like permease